jgi:O-antigen ligase
MIFFSALFLCIFGIFAWRRFEWALAALVFAMPLYLLRFSLGPIPSTVLEGMILVMVGIWVVREWRARKKGEWKLTLKQLRTDTILTILSVAIILFLISSVIAVAVSYEPLAGLGLWRAYIAEPFLFFCILIRTFKTTTDLRRVLAASILSALSIALVALYQKLTGWHIPEPWLLERRVTSVYPYPNAVGLYLAPIIPFILALGAPLYAAANRWKKMLIGFVGIGSTGVLGAAIVFAKTEAAYIALLGSFVFISILIGSRVRRWVFTGLVWVGLILLVSPPIGGIVQEKVLLQDWSGHVRRVIWTETAAMLQDHWLWGAGFGGYRTAMENYHTARYLEIFLYPHSLVLNFWTEMGLLGVVSFLAIGICMGILLLKIWRHTRHSLSINGREVKWLALGLLMSLSVIAIHGLVDVPYFKNDLAVFFWTLLGLTVVLYTSSTKNVLK